jgi:hypothetical protein
MCNWVAWWQESLDSQTPDEVARQLADLALAMVRQVDDSGKGAKGGPEAAIARIRSELDYLNRIIEPPSPATKATRKSARARSS